MAKTLFILVICHLIGDYFLQSDFIAKTKGQNWYHLFVHCILYVVPFMKKDFIITVSDNHISCKLNLQPYKELD